jgi:hypothetical protein
MSDSTKTLVGSISALVCLVAIFAIMADCSKAVSRTGSDAVEACVERGGKWIGNNSGTQPLTDFCLMPDKH